MRSAKSLAWLLAFLKSGFVWLAGYSLQTAMHQNNQVTWLSWVGALLLFYSGSRLALRYPLLLRSLFALAFGVLFVLVRPLNIWDTLVVLLSLALALVQEEQRLPLFYLSLSGVFYVLGYLQNLQFTRIAATLLFFISLLVWCLLRYQAEVQAAEIFGQSTTDFPLKIFQQLVQRQWHYFLVGFLGITGLLFITLTLWRPFATFTPWHFSTTTKKVDITLPSTPPVSNKSGNIMAALKAQQPDSKWSAFWQILEKIVTFLLPWVGGAVLVTLLIVGIYHAVQKIKPKEEEVQPWLDADLADLVVGSAPLTKRSSPEKESSNRKKVRRLFKRQVKKARVMVRPGDTPTTLTAELKLKPNAAQNLRQLYQKARYSNAELRDEELQALKRDLK
ncbi:DUF4129 domain-containing protein [Enterococcus nangangensis]|uniref:DUF4129 domain-containing protein n=1 Tax=Enterococcus nangangensis TaxID=2559926 RepID=UPI0010F88B75|nr:DUF4129 domain-containing protein [Enterococcus nangangensis]